MFKYSDNNLNILWLYFSTSILYIITYFPILKKENINKSWYKYQLIFYAFCFARFFDVCARLVAIILINLTLPQIALIPKKNAKK